MWVWRKMLRVLWTAKRTNVSILNKVKLTQRLSSMTHRPILKLFCHISCYDNIEKLINHKRKTRGVKETGMTYPLDRHDFQPNTIHNPISGPGDLLFSVPSMSSTIPYTSQLSSHHTSVRTLNEEHSKYRRSGYEGLWWKWSYTIINVKLKRNKRRRD